jgi:hypothetical protein
MLTQERYGRSKKVSLPAKDETLLASLITECVMET